MDQYLLYYVFRLISRQQELRRMEKIFREMLVCWKCGSFHIQAIDSFWECKRPYKIFMCIHCKHMFVKYEDEKVRIPECKFCKNCEKQGYTYYCEKRKENVDGTKSNQFCFEPDF